jgi:hypothetical protein
MFAFCAGTVGEYYSLLIFGYDEFTQDYNLGIDCTCTTPACDTPPTDCVVVDINELTCGTIDVAAESDECIDCRICSTATGMIEYEADGCYSSDLGCIPTFLIASVPDSTSTDTQSPTQTSPPESSTFPSTTAPTDPFNTVSPSDSFSTLSPIDQSTTVPPTDPVATVPPTDPFASVPPTDPFATSPPTGGQSSPPNNGGATAPSNNGFFGSGGTLVYGHNGLLAVVTMVFLTLSL